MKTIRLMLYICVLFITFYYLEGYRQGQTGYLSKAGNGKISVTILDDFRMLYQSYRQFSINYATNNWDHLITHNRKMGKVQKPHPKWKEFPCKLNNTRSNVPPKTVHELRPGDIDVVGAMGDSLSAGNGMIIDNLLQIGIEYRGLAFSGGGMETWRTALTLPNILKVFNPNLYGFATGQALSVSRNSHLSIGEPMAMSQDLLHQANIFIARVKNDPHVDLKTHWKLLTIFVGSNDICSDMCHHNIAVFLRNHERYLIDTFNLLRNNVPRLVINLMSVPNMVTTLYSMENVSFLCKAVHTFCCSCIFSHSYDARSIRRVNNSIKRWQAIDQYVSELPEFQTDDFIILYQPITANISMPKTTEGREDLRYLTYDCFHWSQLGHAAVANALWNNMLQPKGRKQSVVFKPFEQFECPTEDRPFIATAKNSIE